MDDNNSIQNNMQYHITFKNGHTADFEILQKPVYPTKSNNVGETLYKTFEQVKANPDLTIIDMEDRHYLWNRVTGYVRDEGTLFDIYRSLRNPIVELKLIENIENKSAG